ncbi:hypothetical protein ABS768_04130 [Flavobacterium sp. ST-75]|uniref:Uncharacterized protein n=1 Tax=Flavobacterium rhizophilum TaxID=3163296 RepID=A0ABW8YA68_9FLAO
MEYESFLFVNFTGNSKAASLALNAARAYEKGTNIEVEGNKNENHT